MTAAMTENQLTAASAGLRHCALTSLFRFFARSAVVHEEHGAGSVVPADLDGETQERRKTPNNLSRPRGGE